MPDGTVSSAFTWREVVAFVLLYLVVIASLARLKARQG